MSEPTVVYSHESSVHCACEQLDCHEVTERRYKPAADEYRTAINDSHRKLRGGSFRYVIACCEMHAERAWRGR